MDTIHNNNLTSNNTIDSKESNWFQSKHIINQNKHWEKACDSSFLVIHILNFNIIISDLIILIYCYFLIIGIIAEIFIVSLSLIGFFNLTKWKNPAKIYYLLFQISIFFSFLFNEYLFCYPFICWWSAFHLNLNTNFSFYGCAIFQTIFLNLSFPYIGLFLYFLGDLAQTLENVTTAIFCIHRMFIVLLPLKVNLLHKVFTKWTIYLFVIIIVLISVPNIFLRSTSTNLFGYLMINSVDSYGSFSMYYFILMSEIQQILPTIIITIGTIIILFKIKLESFKRATLINKSLQKINKHEIKTISVLLVSTFLYILFLSPLSLYLIYNQFFVYNIYCNIWDIDGSTYAYLIILLRYNSIWIHVCDNIVFFTMIKDFRQSILKILHIKNLHSTNL